MNGHPSRRDFVSESGSTLGGLWLMRFAPLIAAAQACAAEDRASNADFTTFSAREAADFDAFAARIVPTDETPGAREAGSVYFADRALGDFFGDLLPIVRTGLESLHERATSTAGGASFSELSEARQDEMIGAVEQEDPGFFFFAKTLVLLGMVTDPAYGGNRDKVGFRLLGFEESYAYAPPFGYYDRDEHGAPAPSAEDPAGADR